MKVLLTIIVSIILLPIVLADSHTKMDNPTSYTGTNTPLVKRVDDLILSLPAANIYIHANNSGYSLEAQQMFEWYNIVTKGLDSTNSGTFDMNNFSQTVSELRVFIVNYENNNWERKNELLVKNNVTLIEIKALLARAREFLAR